MADYGSALIGHENQQTEPMKKDADLPGYRYAKALCETARSAAGTRVKGFQRNWDFLMGKNQWQGAATSSAQALDQWAFRGVVNWTFSTVKTKSAMITGSPTDIFCEPLDDQSSYYDRLLVKSSIEHELTRLRFKQVKEDVYLWGSVTGVGIAMVTTKPDPLTGVMALSMMPVKSSEFFRDPSADCITSPDCRFVVWEPELDMSTIRKMWPSKIGQVKPETRQVTGGFTYKADSTDDNLIYGTSGEFVVDQQNTLRSRKAKVSFVWVKDESIIEDLNEIVLKGPQEGYRCISCEAIHEPDSMPGGLYEGSPCPMCGGDMETAQIPAKTRQETVIRRAYPYGRLIVYSGDTLLFDGENPYELENVFPFAVYHHERIPGDFYGSNDVVLLESLQDAQNRTIGQIIDYVRLAVNGPFEYAVGCKSYTEMGNGPAERHPVPDHLFGKARFVTPDGFNVQAWSALHSAIEHQFQIVSGLASLGLGQTSSPPISATEAEIANSRLSDRMKGHANAFSTFCTDTAEIVYQMMIQHYSDPRTIAVTMPDSEIKSVEMEFQKLPKVRVRVEINTQEAVKDKLLGQNLAAFATPGPNGQSGLDSPYADIVLEAFGVPANRIKELLARRGLHQQISPPGMAPPQQPGDMQAMQPQGGMGA